MNNLKKLFIPVLFLLISTNLLMAQTEAVVNNHEQSTEKSTSLVGKVEAWYEEHINYTTITLLMIVESSFVPFPSEIVVPPAAYIASNPENDMNIYLVVFFATLGALIGALINYYLAVFLGRPIIYRFVGSKYGRLFLLNPEKVQKAEQYFNKYGNISTLIGRLIPGVRQLISIPAGLARMKMSNFLLYTFIGAGIWNIILALMGYVAHGQKDLIDKYSHEISDAVLYLLLAAVVVFAIIFVVRYLKKKRRMEEG